MTAAPQTHYLSPDQFDDPPAPFRSGRAGRIGVDETGDFELQEQLALSANSTHALLGHGVIDQLNELDLEGRIGEGMPALIRPALLEAARKILYAADTKTYGGSWEFVVHRDEDPSGATTEYRVAVNNREYQVTLVRLIDVLNRASRIGEGVWIEV